MEKIVLVQHTRNEDNGAADFACYLAALTNSVITAVFLDNEFQAESYSGRTVEQLPDKKKSADERIAAFKKSCETKSIRCAVHIEKGDPASQIIRESRYADILIVAGDTGLEPVTEDIPTSFLSHILHHSECPVFIAPVSFAQTNQIIFANDGSKAAMYAIRQFSYLFPQLDDNKITVLQVRDGDNADPSAEHELLKGWLRTHYNSIGFMTIHGDTETSLLAYLVKKENAIVVLGAYGRSSLASVFRKSHADPLIRLLNQPIFIAHP